MPESRSRHILVAGGAGGVGEGIVRALLADPEVERVIVSSRDAEKLAALRRGVGGDRNERFVPIVGSLGDAVGAETLRARVAAAGPLDAVVASLGGWWEGGLLETDDATWGAVLDELLATHLRCARAFIPQLEKAAGRYLVIGGGAALRPVPRSSLVSIAAAAQVMFVRALVAERGEARPPLIAELLIDAGVKTRGPHHGPVGSHEVTASEVGAVVAAWLRDGTTGNWTHVRSSGPLLIMTPRGCD